jgi:hypothetical protein
MNPSDDSDINSRTRKEKHTMLSAESWGKRTHTHDINDLRYVISAVAGGVNMDFSSDFR